MTAQEREILVDASIPATQRHSAILMWMIRLYYEGRASGHIGGGSGFEQQTIEKFHIIRSQYGAIGDELQGRMPLAYAHIVQVLVDLILWMYPVMALSSGMSPFLTIIGTGLLTVSYQGLFDLAKQFLDPYDNENYGKGEDPLCVDTLIAETNAGSVRWMYGFEELPFSAQRLKDGELYDYLLPVRGYSVEELAQMEEERIQKEKELEEQRRRDEERLKQEEAERLAMEEGEEDYGKAGLEIMAQDATAVLDDANVTILDGAITNLNKVEALGATNATKSEMQIPTGATNTTTEEQPARPLHKVTTLAGGKAVTFKPGIPAAPANPAVPLEVPKYLASLQKPAPAEQKRQVAKIADVDTFVPDMVNLEMSQGLPSFDEIEPDGQEIRLNQMLVAEEWEKEAESPALTYELVEAAENELKETKEIFNVSAGVEDVDKVLEQRDKKKGPPKYDQTRLDGISQLLPPEDSVAFAEMEQPETIEDVGFYGISQLFGGAGGPTPKTSDDKTVGMSELRGESIEDLTDSDSSDSRPPAANDGNDNDGEGSSGSSSKDVTLPNEVGPDGKEYRSSEMLADEEQNAPMTLDDYNVQVSEILAAAEEELLETEAILMAAPGADPLGWDYEDDQLMPMTNVTKAEVSTESEDLDVLEMDANDLEDIDLEDMESDFADEELGTPDVDDSDETLNGEDDEEANDKTGDEETAENHTSENSFLVTEMNEDVFVEPTLSTVEEEEAKGSDKIEPIMIDIIDGIDEIDSSGGIEQAGDEQASAKDDVEEDAHANETQDKNDTEDKKLTVGEEDGGDNI
jgi:hypothetical protein